MRAFQPNEQASQLLMLRLWVENLDHGRIEIRGQVKHVLTGETVYFREWSTLLDFLQERLAVDNPTAPSTERQEMKVVQKETSAQREIAAVNNAFMQHFEQQDAAAMATLYTSSAQILPPNSDVVSGGAAIQSFWQALFDLGISRATLEIAEVEQCGETAFEVSRFILYGPDGQVIDRGKYIVIWKQVNSEWKLHRDIFNSSLPAAGQ